MEPGIGVLIAAAGVVAGLSTNLAHTRRVKRVWAEVARELGLIQVSDRGVLAPTVRAATSDGLRVSAEVIRRRHGAKTRVEVAAPSLLPETLELRRESLVTAFEKRFDHPDVETGDEAFDRAVFARGHPSLVVALLNAETRDGVLRLLRAGGWVARGQVVLETHGSLADREKFRRHLEELVDLARRLCAPRDPAALLAANAGRDSLPGVRLRNLELLVERFPERAETKDALRAALEDRDPAVRLHAARSLGPEGHPVLDALACASDTPERIAVEAIRAIGRAVGAQRAAALLDRALAAERRDLALAAVEALGQAGGPRAAERLTPLLAEADEELAAAAVRGLVATGDPRTPAALVTALDHRGRPVRLAAAAALGQAGGVEAVPALRAAVAAHPTDLGLRRAVAGAIAAIQERAGASAGQLALAAGEAGGLALAEGLDTGRVALTEGES